MTEFTQALIATGILGTFSVAAGLITIKIAEHIVDEAEKMEDEQPVEYNEEDQK